MERVLPEPRSDFVTVKIRHPSLGLQSRKFPTHTLMNSVYDWAGSLATEPEHFTLNDPLGKMLLPMFFLNTTRVVSYFTRTFKNNLKVTVTRDDSQRWFSAPHSVARLEQGCNYSKQCRNNVVTLCCAKSRRCESSRVTLPLR